MMILPSFVSLYRSLLILMVALVMFSSPLFADATGDEMYNNPGQKKPNILFILADDLGLEGISTYGGNLVDTPNIDRLGREGMKFTHMFVNPYCTPTRSELLTGRYPFATNTSSVIWDYERHKEMVLDTSQPSFARQLKQVGYKTAIAGKWQLSFLSKQDWVHDFGFDTYMLWQIISDNNERTTRYHSPYYRSNGKIVHEEIKDWYGPDVMVDFLTEFMQESHKEGKPFMAYYTSLLPHFPWVPTPDSKDSSMAGSLSSGNSYGIPKYYPDMVRRVDYNVGRLLKVIDELGIADNTVVIFLTDNGTDQHLYSVFNGRTLYGGKATFTDRGTNVPLLVRWPGKIQPNSINSRLVEAADILPTLCEIGGAPLPEQSIHGTSFAKSLTGDNTAGSKEWVHIQKASGRYLRTKEWIITAEGTYKKVKPYPVDAVEVDKKNLDKATRDQLGLWEQELKKLKK